jgi:hypothetical protein
MNLQVTTTLKSEDDKGKKNGFYFESYTEGIQTLETSSGQIVNTYQLDKIQKFDFLLEPDNTFDKNLVDDILNGIDVDEISGLHVFCYNSTESDDNAFPVQFELWNVELVPTLIMKVSQFSFFNAVQSALNFSIKNIVVPAGKIVNLSIIVTLKTVV